MNSYYRSCLHLVKKYCHGYMTSIVLEFWFPDIFFGYVRQMNRQDIKIFRMETLAGDEVKL